MRKGKCRTNYRQNKTKKQMCCHPVYTLQRSNCTSILWVIYITALLFNKKKVLVYFMVCSENVKRKTIYFQDLTHKLSKRTITKQKKQKDILEPPISLPTVIEKHTQIKRKTRKRLLPVHSCLFQTLIY